MDKDDKEYRKIIETVIYNIKKFDEDVKFANKLLSEKTGIDPATICRIKKGKCVTIKNCVKLSKAMKTTPRKLLFKKIKRNK